MTEKKNTYKGSSPAQRRAVAKYHAEKVEALTIRVPKGKRDYYKRAAASVGQSLNQFALSAMDEKMEREGISGDE